MALETLKGIKSIDGFDVIVMDDLREKFPEKFNESGAMDWKWFESEIRPNHFIYVRNDKNSISFTIQNGPIKEKGLNGCQIDTLVATALVMVNALNAKYPCYENGKAADKLAGALQWLAKRRADRVNRGVEGTSNA